MVIINITSNNILPSFPSEMQVAIVLYIQLLSACSAVHMKVGIYNEIPDLNNDKLASYKNMIESGFNDATHTVDAVVDTAQYSPYGDLNAYLAADGFDLIEMDTADLQSVVSKDLIMEIPTGLPYNLLQSSVSAVTIDGHVYAYPTLVCGNFIIALKPRYPTCDLKTARSNFEQFSGLMKLCQETIEQQASYSWERLLGGKMNDGYGWYLPFIYLDGYIDIHGRQSVNTAVNDVINGKVDSHVCDRLSWLIGTCNDISGPAENKCYVDFPGSYVNSSSNVYPDVENYKTYMYFGFSEKLAQIEKDGDRDSYAVISGPLGQKNLLLQFTDALVINKARWNAASEGKRNAIVEFVQYFMSNSLRTKIAMGTDLSPPRIRYLLQATATFYEETNVALYSDIYWSLLEAVAVPSLTTHQRSAMQDTLTKACVVGKSKTPDECSGVKKRHTFGV